MALALGLTVKELLTKMTSREIEEWRAYSRLEPFGPRAEEIRTARIICTILNTTPRKEGHNKVYKPEDFVLNYEDLADEILTPREEKMKKAKEELKSFAQNISDQQKNSGQKTKKRVRR